MAIELRITSGSRAGQRELLDKPVVVIGRHPDCDVRFHLERDTDVSARHAELRTVAGSVTLHDLRSTNGTFVNGTRIGAARLLRDGDVISFGAEGPTAEFRFVGAVPPTELRRSNENAAAALQPSGAGQAGGAHGAGTTARVAAAVSRQTRTLRTMVAALGALVVVVLAATSWMRYRDNQLSGARTEALLRGLADARATHDSLNAALRATLRAQLSQASGRSNAAALADSLRALEARTGAFVQMSQADVAGILRRNMPAVVFIAVRFANGELLSGSGFNVQPGGLVVTNRHLVMDDQGALAKDVKVIFEGTAGQWRRASVFKVSPTDELAWITIDEGRDYPVVHAIANADTPPAGTPLTIIGYPLGTSTAGMGGDINALKPRASIVMGLASKALRDTLQIDAWAAEGSSGSPVFDANGAVVGVVFGGPRESNGRIVYAVPSAQLLKQMPTEGRRP